LRPALPIGNQPAILRAAGCAGRLLSLRALARRWLDWRTLLHPLRLHTLEDLGRRRALLILCDRHAHRVGDRAHGLKQHSGKGEKDEFVLGLLALAHTIRYDGRLRSAALIYLVHASTRVAKHQAGL